MEQVEWWRKGQRRFGCALCLWNRVRGRDLGLLPIGDGEQHQPAARRAVAGLWQQFSFTAYPDVPDLVRRAEARVGERGGMYRKTGVSRPFRPVRDYIGWKPALRLQRLYQRFRYGAA